MNSGSESSKLGTTIEEGLKPAAIVLTSGVRFEDSGEDDAASITIIIIIINIFYFNCAFSKLIWTNLCKQSASHNTPLRELGHVPVTLFLI
jgi:hypothetical protein